MLRIRLIAGVAGLVLLSACSLDVGSIDIGARDIGKSIGIGGSAKVEAQAVGDEPYAVKAGAAILAQGGSAADAAAAMYFALAATYPSAAGLGGGGVCVVHDARQSVSEVFSFLPRQATAGGEFAVPGNVKGFATLQAAYGRLMWRKVVAQGESYASTGFPISRALAARLADGAAAVRLDAALAGEFMDESGKLKAVGAIAADPALARTLAAIRENGADAFYSGKIAAALVAYAAQNGGSLSLADLSGYKVERSTPRVMQAGGNYVFLPAAGSGVGVFVAALIDAVARGNADTSDALPALAQKTLAGLNMQNGASERGATGFAVTDANGQAVACAVTMNAPFGTGRTVRAAGVTLARAPMGEAAANALFLAPAIAAPNPDAPAVLAGAGAGGPSGSIAIADALLKLAQDQAPISRKELHGGDNASHDTVNVIACSQDACVALPDPTGHGYGMAVPSVH